MSKSVDTLVADIDKLFVEGHDCDPQRTAALGQQIAEIVAHRLAEPKSEEVRDPLRISNLGKRDRQLWYAKHRPDISERLSPATLRKFLFGDIWEHILLFLCKESGHEVTHEQELVHVDGVPGHTDCVIDGVVVDAKTASPYGFQKFKDGSLRENDSFGYMEQLAGYSEALGRLDGAFLAVDKVSGKLTLLQIPRAELEGLKITERTARMREILESPTPPDCDCGTVDFGESGNEVLSVNGSYCPCKFDCWKDANDGIGLRTFLYSNGPKHFTKVTKEPKVLEVTF